MQISRREFIQAAGMAAVTCGLIGAPREVKVRVSDEEMANIQLYATEDFIFRKLREAGADVNLGIAFLVLKTQGTITVNRLWDSRHTEYTWRA